MSGCIFTIYVSKDEAVCCEVKTHVGSFRFARFMKKISGCNFTIYASKNEAVCCSDACWKFSACKVHTKSSGRIFTVFVSKHVAVCREVQTDFRRFFRANFIKKIWGHFLDLCVQNKNCLSSDACWKFSP